MSGIRAMWRATGADNTFVMGAATVQVVEEAVERVANDVLKNVKLEVKVEEARPYVAVGDRAIAIALAVGAADGSKGQAQVHDAKFGKRAR